MNTSHRVDAAFRISTHIMFVLLVLEFILGMYTALFVKFPETLVDGNAWEWSMAQSPIVVAHVTLGTLMAILSIFICIFGVAMKNKVAIIISLVGLVTVWFAYLSGSVFLSNIEADSYSFTMSLGFIAALVAYAMAPSLVRTTSIARASNDATRR
jgi:hypothetical protein